MNFEESVAALQKEYSQPQASIEAVGTKLEPLLSFLFTNPAVLYSRGNGATKQLLEIACYHSAYRFDGAAFERYFSILFAQHALAVDHLLVGMQLLNLLVTGRKNEFHLMLARISPALLISSPFLGFAFELEKALSEGAFHRIILSKEHVPTPEYAWFVEGLAERIRNDIADCLTAASDRIDCKDAQSLLFFDGNGPDLFMAFCQLRGWSIIGDQVLLKSVGSLQEDQAQLHPHSLLLNSLLYAKKLEQSIV